MYGHVMPLKRQSGGLRQAISIYNNDSVSLAAAADYVVDCCAR